MVEIHGDVAFTLAEILLGHINDRLASVDAPVKRSLIAPGGALPADDCCDGIAWVRVAQIVASDGNNNPSNAINNWSIPSMGASVTLEMGVLRCAPTLDGQGRPPSASKETDAARVIAYDRWAVRMAVLCDLPADIGAVGADGQAVGVWTPVGGDGCAGGFMTTTIGVTAADSI